MKYNNNGPFLIFYNEEIHENLSRYMHERLSSYVLSFNALSYTTFNSNYLWNTYWSTASSEDNTGQNIDKGH